MPELCAEANSPHSAVIEADEVTPPFVLQPKSQPKSHAQLSHGTLAPCRYHAPPCQAIRLPGAASTTGTRAGATLSDRVLNSANSAASFESHISAIVP